MAPFHSFKSLSAMVLVTISLRAVISNVKVEISVEKIATDWYPADAYSRAQAVTQAVPPS